MASLKNYLKQKGFVSIKLSRTQTDHFEVKATLNGVLGSFILDTGASNTCIGLDKAEKFDLVSEASDIKAAGAGSSEMEARISHKNQFAIGKWKKKKLPIVLLDLSHVNLALTLRTDAKENLITSVQIAALQNEGRPVVQEVCLYFENKLYRGNRTTKMSAEQFQAFDSPNYPTIGISGVHLRIKEENLLKPAPHKALRLHTELDNRIGLLKLFPGIHPAWVRVLLGNSDMKALVLESYGAGNATTESWFLSALQTAVSSGLHMYMLGRKVSPKSFKTIFETSLRGEMT